MRTFVGLSIAVLLTSVVSLTYGQVTNLKINGSSTTLSMVSGDQIQWEYNLPVGGSALCEIWYDVNGNGAIEPGTDKMFSAFSQIDGGSTENGPPDMDGVANGHIIFQQPVGIAPGKYVLRFSNNGTGQQIAGAVSHLASPVHLISGRVTAPLGKSPQYIFVELHRKGNQSPSFWDGMTDVNGDYTIEMNSDTAGNPWRLNILSNPYPPSVLSPDQLSVTVTGNHSGFNFSLLQAAAQVAGYVRDENNNRVPFAGVNINMANGSTYRYVTSDATGSFQIGLLTSELWATSWSLQVETQGNSATTTTLQARRQLSTIHPSDSLYRVLTVYSVNSQISGLVRVNGYPPGLPVQLIAWNADTAQASVYADGSTGNFTIPVSNKISNYDIFAINLPQGYSSPTALAHPGNTGVLLDLSQAGGTQAPASTTDPATSISQTSATLNGSVNPNGSVATAWFEWGTSNTLATYTATSSQSIGSGTSAVAVTANLSALSPNITYYYRVVGQNTAGIQRGSISSFITLGQIPTNGLVAYYPFNGNANDESGNGNNGTVHGASLTVDRFGNPDKAYAFNGTSDYIVVGDSPSLRTSNAISISTWIKLYQNVSMVTKAIIVKGIDQNYVNPDYLLVVDHSLTNSNVRPHLNTGGNQGWNYFNGTTVLNDNVWYHLVVTYDGSVAKTFVNGLNDGSKAVPSPLTTSPYPLSIGTTGAARGLSYFPGYIDDIRIYNRALSSEEILALYYEESGISVSLPDTTVISSKTVEIPVYAGDLTGKNVLAYQFTATFNTPNNILTASTDLVTTGTLSGASGWSALPNISVPNQITVGAFGANPLSGGGVLLKLKFTVNPGTPTGQYSNLQFSNFIFNTGTPAATTANGKITARLLVCGDADENGSIQAYDAALTLREAIGPMPPPPPPLTAQGRINADVDMNGSIQAYDAALILRKVIGLSMPQGVSTCFSGLPKSVALESSPVNFNVSVASVQRDKFRTSAQLAFTGVTPDAGIMAISFDVAVAEGADNSSSLAVSGLSEDYMHTINRVDNEHFKVGIINPHGITTDDIRMTIGASREESLKDIRITNILLNSTPAADIALTGTVANVIPTAYDLVGCYPNPFNPSTTIRYGIPVDATVSLAVYNTLGQKVSQLVQEHMSAGYHDVVFDASQLASGIYFYRMQAVDYVATKKILLLR